MSIPKKTHELIRQNEQIVKKSQKHDANLQKNSTLYFQVGLIICLLAAYGLLEMNFETTVPKYVDLPPIEDPTYIDVPLIKPIEPTFEEPVEEKKVEKSQVFEEVPDDFVKKVFEDNPTEKPSNDVNPPIDSGDIDVLPPPDPVDVPFRFIEEVPIYPGCEKKKTNDERRKCMSEKITKLVQRKFDTDLGSELGLSGKQVIQTQFKIDKTGKVIDIKTRSVYPKLKKEAERVINKIPEMVPGKQRDVSVGVIYNLPIVFFIQN